MIVIGASAMIEALVGRDADATLLDGLAGEITRFCTGRAPTWDRATCSNRGAARTSATNPAPRYILDGTIWI